jgi:hypothetical protein
MHPLDKDYDEPSILGAVLKEPYLAAVGGLTVNPGLRAELVTPEVRERRVRFGGSTDFGGDDCRLIAGM